MKKTYTMIMGLILIISILSGCQEADVAEEGMAEEAPVEDIELKSEGEIKLSIIKQNTYGDIQGINAPTGKAGYIIKDGIYHVKLLEGFKLMDEGDIYLYVSEKNSLMGADDLKEGAYEVSIITEKEGTQEYRISNDVPTDKINSVAFYKKDENALVAWAILE